MGLLLLTPSASCPGCGCVPSRDLPTALEEIFFVSTTSLGPSAHSTELLEQSWPRICSEITPGAGEAENPISAGLVGAVRALQLRVSLSQLWDTGLAQQP